VSAFVANSVKNQVHFDPVLTESSSTVATTTTTSPSDTFVDSASLAFPAYQSEVIVPAVGSPIGVGRPPAVTVGVGTTPGRSAGLSPANVWNSVSRSPFLTPTKDRMNPLSTVAEILNWNSESTTETTTSSSPVDNNNNNNNNNNNSTGSCNSSSMSNVAIRSSLLNAVKRDKTFSVSSGSDLITTSSVSTDALAKSSSSTTEADKSTSTCSFDPNRHLSSLSGSRGPGPGASQPCQGSTQSAGRSLWAGGWQTAELALTSTELRDRGTSDPCPPTMYINAAVRPRRQPLRLVLIKTVGTDNVWSAKPSTSSNPPARPRAAVSRPDRVNICGSLSETALTDLSRWTELNSLRTGRDHHQHLPANRNINLVSVTVACTVFTWTTVSDRTVND